MEPEHPERTGETRQQTAAKQEAVESVSTEGRPADPEFRGCGTAVAFAIIAMLLMVIGIAVAIIWNVPAGVATGVVGAVLFAVNPVLWASVGRAKERSRVLKQPPDR